MYNILAREIVCVYLCVVVYVSEYGLCMAQRVFNIQMSERAKEGRQRRSNSVTGKVLKRTDFSTSTLCVCVCAWLIFIPHLLFDSLYNSLKSRKSHLDSVRLHHFCRFVMRSWPKEIHRRQTLTPDPEIRR